MERANCILMMMKKVLVLNKEMKKQAPYRNKSKGDGKYNRKPCLFDQNCPAVRCPFRTHEASNAFVERLIKGTRPRKSPKKKLKNEIVDGPDLFIVNVGRVDPCREGVPVYQDGFTQCFETDFPTIPLPPPIENKPKKGKKLKKKKGKSK